MEGTCTSTAGRRRFSPARAGEGGARGKSGFGRKQRLSGHEGEPHTTHGTGGCRNQPLAEQSAPPKEDWANPEAFVNGRQHFTPAVPVRV